MTTDSASSQASISSWYDGDPPEIIFQASSIFETTTTARSDVIANESTSRRLLRTISDVNGFFMRFCRFWAVVIGSASFGHFFGPFGVGTGAVLGFVMFLLVERRQR
jgi:hypothetical protein